MSLIYLYLFVSGLTLGSFYNVAGLRIPQKKSILSPRSHCPYCLYVLSPQQLIPIVSYIKNAGKCSMCRKKISFIYPFVEFSTGSLFVYAFFRLNMTLELIVILTFVSFLTIIVVSDIAYMIVPNKVLLFFLPIFLLERLFIPLTSWSDSLMGGGIAFFLLFLIAFLSRGGLGEGDIKLYGLIGIVLGVKLVLLSLFLAILIGGTVSIGALLMKKAKVGVPIPFVPFIFIGTIAAYFHGNELIDWYVSNYFY